MDIKKKNEGIQLSKAPSANWEFRETLSVSEMR
ncbi:hypothetical protein QG37_07908 [Candidozyma auris]|uniref:Uncharacterized protein n=1 Tax=Candidozyma auris TaxID=498019 RepID=A0A0L0NNT1_CANAR|nr:hypothetical protein QG37_07908 [[Candida] auris]